MVLTRRLVRVNAELNVYQSNRSLQNRHWLERRASDGSFFESSRLCRQTAGGQIGQKFLNP